MFKRKVYRGAALLAGSRAVAQACALGRNIILARLLSPHDFGIAASIWVAVSLLEMISNLAADRLIVQAPGGNEPHFQANLHLVQAVRGVLNAALLVALARPVAVLFGIPDAWGAFAAMAAWPLTRGLAHLDIRRLHRDMRFRPEVTVDLTSQFIALAAAFPLAAWLDSYWAVVWLSIGQALLYAFGTHLIAERPYRWSADRAVLRHVVAFGWPLLVNGLLMFGIFQGDRFVIGSAQNLFGTGYTMADLGAYSVAFMLTSVPTLVLAQTNSALTLPALSAVQGSPVAFGRRYRVCVQALAVLSALVVVVFIVLGGPLLVAVFGEKYAPAAPLVMPLAAMQAVRLVRAAPSMAAMSRGDTVNMMLANIGRSSALIGMFAAAAAGLNLIWIATAALGGELVALAVASGRLRRRHDLPVAYTARAFSVTAIAAVAAAGLQVAVVDGWRSAALVAAALLLGVAALAVAVLPDLRQHLAELRPSTWRSMTPWRAEAAGGAGGTE